MEIHGFPKIALDVFGEEPAARNRTSPLLGKSQKL